MKAKDIILQVSEETAGIMEEISNQMFDETDARFEEVNQSVKEVISNLESFIEEFEDYVSKTKKDLTSNKEEILKELENIKEKFVCLQQNSDKQIQNSRDYNEKLEKLIDDVSKIESMISGNRESIEKTSEKVNSCLGLLKKLSEYIEVTEKHDREIYDIQQNNTEKLEKLIEEEQQIRAMLQTLEVTVGRISEITSIVDRISVQQNEIREKQEKIEKDVEYLKLPFYRKWFRKGN